MKKNTTIAALFLFLSNILHAEDWPQWRGPHQDGVSTERGWSHEWESAGPKRLWEFSVGSGNGAIAVVGDRLYTIGASGETEETDTVFCLNTDSGEVIWRHTYSRHERLKRTPTRRAATNTTPTVHQGKVYTYSGDAQLYCLDAKGGDVVWSRELMKELDARNPQYDYNASPVIVEDLVIVLAWLPDASIIAFNKDTGKDVWRAYHKTRRGGLGGFWSTPVSRKIDGKPCLVYLPGLSVVGLDPKTGETQWKHDFVEQGIEQAERGAVAASPVVVGDRIFFPFHPDHGRGFSECVEISNGEVKPLWKSKTLAHWWHSPVVWKDRVIALDQGPAARGNPAGALCCYDVASGSLLWSTYSIGEKARASLTKGAKMMLVGDRLLIQNDSGYVIVARPTDTGLERLATMKPFRRIGKDYAVPVLSNGRLYFRSGREKTLACFDVTNQ